MLQLLPPLQSNSQCRLGPKSQPAQSALKPVEHFALHKGLFESIAKFSESKSSLEAGKAPEGKVVLCPSVVAAQDLARLATLHNLVETICGLVVKPVPGTQTPPQFEAMHLPTWEANKPNIRLFWVRPLGAGLPRLPAQKPKHTTVTTETEPLCVFRTILVRDFCCKDLWETFKRNPIQQVRKLFSAGIIHSSYGWRELKLVDKSEKHTDTVLQGFVRVKKQHKSHVCKLLCDSGLFFEELTSQGVPKPPVCWLPKKKLRHNCNILPGPKQKPKRPAPQLPTEEGVVPPLGCECCLEK